MAQTAKKAKMEPTNINILNAVRNVLKQDISYTERIPIATQNNIAKIYENFSQYEAVRNQLVGALYGLIGSQTVRTDTWQNVFEGIKREPMRYGSTEQDIWVNMAKGFEFDPLGGADRAFAIYRAYIMNAHHHVNFWEQYAVTITWEELQSAFLSETGLQTLVTAKIASLQSGANWDEYLCSLEVVQSANNGGHTYPVTVPRPVDEATTKSFLTKLLEYAGLAKFPLPEHNAAGATSSQQDPNDLVLVTTPGVIAFIRVYAQAYAFNERYLRDPLRQIIIHKFNNENTVANLIDVRWFNIRDHFRTTGTQHNASSLNTNHFLTVAEMFSYSPFFKNFHFVTNDTAVTGITVALPSSPTPNKGVQLTLDVTVTGTGEGYLQTYSLELEGNTSVRTYIIPGTPILVIGQDEKATTMTVTAKSLYNPTITNTLTITLP